MPKAFAFNVRGYQKNDKRFRSWEIDQVFSLACGVPVVSTDCRSGPREILAPDTDFRKQVKDEIEFAKYGVLVPVPDGKWRGPDEPLTKEEKLLAEAILRLLGNEALRAEYITRAEKRIKDFHIDRISEELYELLCSCLS